MAKDEKPKPRHGDYLIVNDDERRLTDSEMVHADALLDAYKRCKSKGPDYEAEAAALRAQLDPIALSNTVVGVQVYAADAKAWGEPNLAIPNQVTSTNEQRDRWLYEQKLAGQTHSQLMAALRNDHPEWDFIDTVQGIGLAVDRYCERNNLALVRRKR